ncbi:hypothetical protein DFH11DRAFT_1551248 [Phellopilus nigrolimitatus]|nr:hypothetical protein DFH11DRAFT_1551248 [Phellopilus nigrolimitatus]
MSGRPWAYPKMVREDSVCIKRIGGKEKKENELEKGRARYTTDALTVRREGAVASGDTINPVRACAQSVVLAVHAECSCAGSEASAADEASSGDGMRQRSGCRSTKDVARREEGRAIVEAREGPRDHRSEASSADEVDPVGGTRQSSEPCEHDGRGSFVRSRITDPASAMGARRTLRVRWEASRRMHENGGPAVARAQDGPAGARARDGPAGTRARDPAVTRTRGGPAVARMRMGAAWCARGPRATRLRKKQWRGREGGGRRGRECGVRLHEPRKLLYLVLERVVIHGRGHRACRYRVAYSQEVGTLGPYGDISVDGGDAGTATWAVSTTWPTYDAIQPRKSTKKQF